MTLSKRERYIAIAAGLVVGLLAMDRFVLTPWLELRHEVATRLELQRGEAARAEQVFDNRRRANRRWAELARGTLTVDAPSAEGQLLNALRDWAQASGLSLTAVRPDRGVSKQGFEHVTVRATGSGDMSDVTQFLWQIENASIPARIEEMQIATRRPGADELTLQLAVSTIYLPPTQAEGARP